MVHARANVSEAKTITDFPQDFPIFDALIELEQDTKKGSFKDDFMDQVLNFQMIESEFSKLHLLIDKLYQNEDDLTP